MTYPNRNRAFRIGCLVFILILPQTALSSEWYVGPGFTQLSLDTKSSSISFEAFNALAGSPSDGTSDVKAGSAVPSLAIGRTFGENDQWLVETTISPGFDETVYADGQKFATAKIMPLNLFGAYQGKKHFFGESSVSVRPVFGGGIIYVFHTDTDIVSSQFAASPAAKFVLSDSFGMAVLAGVNIEVKPRLSIVLGLTYLDGIKTKASIKNFDIPVPFVTAQSDIALGGVDLNGLAVSARLQYAF